MSINCVKSIKTLVSIVLLAVFPKIKTLLVMVLVGLMDFKCHLVIFQLKHKKKKTRRKRTFLHLKQLFLTLFCVLYLRIYRDSGMYCNSLHKIKLLIISTEPKISWVNINITINVCDTVYLQNIDYC